MAEKNPGIEHTVLDAVRRVGCADVFFCSEPRDFGRGDTCTVMYCIWKRERGEKGMCQDLFREKQ